MYKSETTASNFKARVAGVIRAGKSIRENIKVLAQFAIVQYLKDGNTECLRYLASEVQGLKSMNANRLMQWCENTTNVKFGKGQDGAVTCRKAVKGEEPALRDGGDIDGDWWDFAKAPVVKVVDMVAEIEKLLKTIASTEGEEAKRPITKAQAEYRDGVASRLLGAKAWLEAELRRAELEGNAEPIESARTGTDG